MIIRLRQVSCAIFDQEHKKDWYDIVQDIDNILTDDSDSCDSKKVGGGCNNNDGMEPVPKKKINNTAGMNMLNDNDDGSPRLASKKSSSNRNLTKSNSSSAKAWVIGRQLIMERFGQRKKGMYNTLTKFESYEN